MKYFIFFKIMLGETLSTSPELLFTPLIAAVKGLKKEVAGSQEKGIIEAPKLTKDKEAVFFDYQDKNGQKWEIVTRKEGDNFSVRIKKRLKGANGQEGRYTQKNGKDETFNIFADDVKKFNVQLGSILDIVIGAENRDRLPKTGEVAFDLLKKKDTKNRLKSFSHKENSNNKKVEKSEGIPGLENDHGAYVYTVQSGDTESGIKAKLSQYEPLNYLKNVPTDISGLNFSSIPNNKLQIGLQILIPPEDKTKSIPEFKNSQKDALNSMKSNTTYGTQIKELIKKYGETHVIDVMTAYAKCESSTENSNKIGSCSLFRYETAHKCCSYGYHHVLYEGIGKTAFKNLGMTIGQTANPKDSGMLFLAFCIEKAKGNQKPENKDFKKFFDMNNTTRCGACYNGDKEYGNKLKNNYNQVHKA